MRGTGRHVDTALHYQQQLEDAGFTDIGTVRERWPTNHWPRDKKYKQIGKCPGPYKNCLGAIPFAFFTNLIQAFGPTRTWPTGLAR